MLTQVFRFCVVGTVVFAVDFAALWVLQGYLPQLVAVSVAYFLAVAVHFSLNRWWVFGRNKKFCATELGQYSMMVAACWLCTVLVVWIALQSITANVLIAKALAVPPATFLSFVLMQRFVFR
jgi:putative flippase GtrA